MNIQRTLNLTVFILCLLSVYSSRAQKWEWLTGGGARYDQRIRGVAVDGSGNTYATGFVNDSLIVQGSKLVMKSGGMFLAKFDAQGKLVFLKGYGTGTSTEAQAIVYDKKGYVYITGNYSNGKITFGSINLTTPNSNANRAFLAKLDLNGNGIWAVNVNEGNSALSYRMRYNEKDSTVVVGGYFQGTAKFYINKDSFSTRGSYDLFIAAFNSVNGALKWADVGGSKNFDAISYIDFDVNNNVYMSFMYQRVTGADTFKSRQIRLPVTSAYDGGLVKYNPGGKLIWQKSVSGSGDQYIRGMRMGHDNHLYLIVYSAYNNSINFFGTNYKVNYQYENILIKMDTSGKQLKRKEAYVAGLGASSDLERDSLGNLYILGANSFRVDNANAIGNGNDNFFLIKMDTALYGLKAVTGGKKCTTGDLIVDAGGTCICGGGFDWIKDSVFKTGTFGYKNRGDEDMYLTRWNFDDSCKKPKPQISFSRNGNAYSFTDLGTITTDTRKWRLGDGTTYNTKSPVHQYGSPGVYTVTLTAGNQCGSDSVKTTVYFDCVPRARIRFILSGKKVTFTDSSGAASRIWYFGDGQTAATANVSHTYLNAGYYDVKLVVSNVCGSDSVVERIYLDCIAKSRFGYSVQGRRVTFYDSSVNSNKQIWYFGDGRSDTAKNPVHQFTANGTYKVTLKSLGICFNDSSFQNIVIQCTDPVADFQYTDTNLRVWFFSKSKYNGGQIWRFGDGNSDTARNPVYRYKEAGSYKAELITWNGCSRDSMSKLIQIACPKPEIHFTFTTTGRKVIFEGSTRFHQVGNWRFDFGDGTTGNMQYEQHEYTQAGEYKVFLIADNPCGSDTFSTSINIECETRATFSHSSEGSSVNFSDKSVFASTRIWDFGDGTTDTSRNPVHRYLQNGTYRVRLIAVGVCNDTLTEEVVINCTPPKPRITYSVNGKTARFTALSDKPGVSSWHWDFGNGQTDTIPNPEIMYQTDGMYKVILTGNNDCRPDTANALVTIQTQAGWKPVERCTLKPAIVTSDKKMIVESVNCQIAHAEIELCNAQGYPVLTAPSFINGNRLTVSVENLPAGIYYLRIRSGNQYQFHQKLFLGT